MMRVEVIKMTLQKRDNSVENPVHQIERPLKIYGSITSFSLLYSFETISSHFL